MPKMTHWNSPDVIDVSPEKAAIYQAQGWTTVEKRTAPKATAMTRATVDEPAPAPVKKAAAKRAPAKKSAKK